MSSSEENRSSEGYTSFAQEYDAKAKSKQTLHIYCRLCRRIFPVSFKPRPDKRLRCVCGHECAIAELDVFKTEARAKDFAGLYEKIYKAAKDALRAANFPVPPSGKLPQIRDGMDDPSDILDVNDDDPEDMSDIRSSYVGEGSDVRGDEAREREHELREAVEAAGDDVLAKHEALSQLVEHLYCVRHVEKTAMDRFDAACREDMIIAPEVVAEAKRLLRAGKKVRISFSSFKHLAIVLEEEDDLEGALEVCEAAIAVGLKDYDDRAKALKSKLGKSSKKSNASRDGFRKSGSSVGKMKALPSEEPPRGLGSSDEMKKKNRPSSSERIPSDDEIIHLDDDDL
ncbi:MAG: hypothetical protein ACAI25_11035 [Planctomycetota bacterium]